MTNTNNFAPALALIPAAAIAAVGTIVAKKIRNKKNDDNEFNNSSAPEWALENVGCPEDADISTFKMAKDICHLDWVRQNKLGLTTEDFDTIRILFAYHLLPMEEVSASIDEAKCLDPMIDVDGLILWAYEINRQRIENEVGREK